MIAWVLTAWISWVVRRAPHHLTLLYLSVLFSPLFLLAHASSFHVNHEVGLFTQEWNSLFTYTKAKGLTGSNSFVLAMELLCQKGGVENIRLSLPLTKLNESWREGTVPRILATLQRTRFQCLAPTHTEQLTTTYKFSFRVQSPRVDFPGLVLTCSSPSPNTQMLKLFFKLSLKKKRARKLVFIAALFLLLVLGMGMLSPFLIIYLLISLFLPWRWKGEFAVMTPQRRMLKVKRCVQ